ncbi:MAG: NAD-dependent epimerase/dehydratase family protein [Phycisphaerae bacterium]
MKALVTGGGGFLGRAVVEQLLARGDQVRSLARGDYPDLEAMGVEVIRGDIRNAEAVRKACADCDVVFHVAGKSGFWGDYAQYYEPNVRGTQNVLAGCRACGVGRLVHTSSPSVVFDWRDMEGVDESVPYPRKYVSTYSETKAIAERAVLAANCDDLRTVALRPHLIWGPRDPHMLPRFVAQRRAGTLRRIGNGSNKIDTTYVDDAARAHLLAAEALDRNPRAAGKAFFLSQGEPLPIWDIINGMLAAAGLGPVTRSVPRLVGWSAGAVLETVYKTFRIKSEPRITRFVAFIFSTSHWFDISAARRELGYAPQVSISQGLRRLKAWINQVES